MQGKPKVPCPLSTKQYCTTRASLAKIKLPPGPKYKNATGMAKTGESVLGGLTSGNPLQILGAVITGAKAVKTVKAAGGIGAIAKAELNGIIATNLTGLQNGSKSISVPGLDKIPGLGNAVGSANGLLNNILTPVAKTRGGGP